MEFNLLDKVSIRGRTVTGWIRMKSRTTPILYRVQTDRELLPEMTEERLTLVERHKDSTND